jgi:hypothetical protein
VFSMNDQAGKNQELSLGDNVIIEKNENMRQQGSKKYIKQILIAVLIVFAVTTTYNGAKLP